MKKEYIFYPVTVGLACVLTLGALEIILRVFFGFPHGSFNYLLSAKNGLYPRNSTTVMSYGFKPYSVRANSWGMRGEEVPFEKTKGKRRVMTLGDSVTDGFFVENDETYPYFLGQLLNESGHPTEILSVAKGGGSIDKEYALLRSVIPLKPDIVILTFVNNDIAEIRGRSRQELLDMKPWKNYNSAQKWFLTKTAIGELVADLKLRMRYRNYRRSDRGEKNVAGTYSESQGMDFAGNLKVFEEKFASAEGLVTHEPFSKETEELINNYFFALKSLNQFCLANSTRLVFVYFPDYSQIYDPSVSFEMRDILRSACKNMDIPFLDLTETLKASGKGRVIHFAPYDFHPNAEGNRIIAGAVAEFIRNIDK